MNESIKAAIIAASGVTGVALLAASMVSASPQPVKPPGPAITYGPPTTGYVGETFDIELDGFAPNSELTVTCTECGGNKSPATSTIGPTDSSGHLSITDTISSTDFGMWSITITDSNGNSASTSFSITQVSPSLPLNETLIGVGNRNILITNADCSIINPYVTIIQTTPIGATQNGYSIQLNATTADGASSYQNVVTFNADGSVQNWVVQVGSSSKTIPAPAGLQWEAGTPLTLTLTPPIATISLGSWKDSYTMPQSDGILFYELDIVGNGSGSFTEFDTSPELTITYLSSTSQITSTTDLNAFPCGASVKVGTVEDSNMGYALPVQTSRYTITQHATTVI